MGIIIYMLIGGLFMFFMDKLSIDQPYEFTNWERLIGSVLWPLALIYFLYHFFKYIDNNGK